MCIFNKLLVNKHNAILYPALRLIIMEKTIKSDISGSIDQFCSVPYGMGIIIYWVTKLFMTKTNVFLYFLSEGTGIIIIPVKSTVYACKNNLHV